MLTMTANEHINLLTITKIFTNTLITD